MGVSEPVPRYRDPWPSPQPAWQDPPWTLSGRVMTAWFDAPWNLLESSVSPDLLPEKQASVRTRLRFYDLRFLAEGENAGQTLAPSQGEFREAAIGFPTCGADVKGETSVFMWSDSDTYVMWAREAFGWPLLRGNIELEGDFWSAVAVAPGLTGSGRVRDLWGMAEVGAAQLSESTESGSPGAAWLTPRRILHAGGTGGETRELQIVRPKVVRSGTRCTGEAVVRFAFRGPHPLAQLSTHDAQLDAVDDFELLVGADVALA